MRAHVKGAKHKDWVNGLTADRSNHYREVIKAKETIRQQTIQLARYERRETARELLVARLEKRNELLKKENECFIKQNDVPEADLLDLGTD